MELEEKELVQDVEVSHERALEVTHRKESRSARNLDVSTPAFLRMR